MLSNRRFLPDALGLAQCAARRAAKPERYTAVRIRRAT